MTSTRWASPQGLLTVESWGDLPVCDLEWVLRYCYGEPLDLDECDPWVPPSCDARSTGILLVEDRDGREGAWQYCSDHRSEISEALASDDHTAVAVLSVPPAGEVRGEVLWSSRPVMVTIHWDAS